MSATRRWTAAETASVVLAPRDHDDKYSRGVVGLHTGSRTYPGAAVLGVEGAWRTGAGLVRYVGDDAVGAFVLQRRPETVLRAGRVGAWVIGSGTDPTERTGAERSALIDLLHGEARVIVDAGALDLIGESSAPLILTPHDGEFAALAHRVGVIPSDDRVADTVALAAAIGHTVLRKGAVTTVAEPDGSVVEVRAATPWLATAGAGDVLAGVIGTLAAQRPTLTGFDIAAAGAWVHGRAARIAAGVDHGNGHPITALDVARALPLAIGDVVASK